MKVVSRVCRVTKGDTVLKYVVQTARVFPEFDDETGDELGYPAETADDQYNWSTVNRRFSTESEARAYADWYTMPEVLTVV
jgi:hypothetical protein